MPTKQRLVVIKADIMTYTEVKEMLSASNGVSPHAKLYLDMLNNMLNKMDEDIDNKFMSSLPGRIVCADDFTSLVILTIQNDTIQTVRDAVLESEGPDINDTDWDIYEYPNLEEHANKIVGEENYKNEVRKKRSKKK